MVRTRAWVHCGGCDVSARYLVRFYDICPTIDWAAWDELEKVLA